MSAEIARGRVGRTIENHSFFPYSDFPVTAKNEIKKETRGGRRKGAGRKARFHRPMTNAERKLAWKERQRSRDGTDDLAERLAVHDAILELKSRISERLQATNPETGLKFCLGYRAGLQCALAEADGYLAEVRLEGELPIVRVRFRA